jgi:hypothetical protein
MISVLHPHPRLMAGTHSPVRNKPLRGAWLAQNMLFNVCGSNVSPTEAFNSATDNICLFKTLEKYYNLI